MTTFAAQAVVEDGVHVVSLSGELDQATVPDLQATLDPVAEDAEAVLIDLERCEFIDSTGLATLVAANARITERGGRFAICCAGSAVERLLEITGAASGLGLEEDRATGVASLSAPA